MREERLDAERAGGDPGPTPLESALERVGDRWTLLVIEALLDGPRRFGDLQRAVPGIAPNVLSQRLKRLEQEALVVAHPYSRRPPRFAYELTEAGGELAGALRLLADWGARHSDTVEPLRHEACGAALEARWWCPSCEAPVAEDEAAETHLL
ncbi:MAG: helix-turn-helix transcriptional regulator [Actinobacteria bacterium]|nr:helix-turn-helix transcriptional regulator [Actinomycetota bacterium]